MLESIANLTEPSAGKEFHVRLTGKGFLPESVFVRVVGPGCPDTSPCIIPNSALRMGTMMSDSVMDRVPLTLESGEFNIATQNGESVQSNSLTLSVP